MRQFQKNVGVMLAPILVLSILAMTGCVPPSSTTTASSSVPVWGLEWYPPQGGVSQNVLAETAFATGVHLLHNADSLPLPSEATTWLATGSDWGIALIRLDPAGAYQDLAIMGVNTLQHTWVANITSVRVGQSCANGRRVFGSLTFPEPVCSLGTLYQTPRSDYAWYFSLTSWYTDQHTYILAHFADQAQRPLDGTEEVELDSTPGWIHQEHHVISIVVPLPGKETFLSACTSAPTLCRAVAQQQLNYRDEFVPLKP